MVDYRLTRRGKFVIGVLIFIQVFFIVYSGHYILEYLDKNNLKITQSNETTTEVEISTEQTTAYQTIETTETTETTQEASVDTTTETAQNLDSSDKIYNAEELNDLKQFRVVFYFDANESSAILDVSDLTSIVDMLETYPDEKITIVGHVNGYPNFENNEEYLELSNRRAKFVSEALVNLGVDIRLINVYNQGSEAPIYSDYGNQYKNDRVEVYFSDHFIVTKTGK